LNNFEFELHADKRALTNTELGTREVSTALRAPVCHTGGGGLGCSPYSWLGTVAALFGSEVGRKAHVIFEKVQATSCGLLGQEREICMQAEDLVIKCE
jgi:hypothetical protein